MNEGSPIDAPDAETSNVLPEGDCRMAIGLQREQGLDVALACDNGLFTTTIVGQAAQKLRHWPHSGRLLGYHWDLHGCDALVAGPSEYDAVGLRSATTMPGLEDGPIVHHVRAWTFAGRQVWADHAGLHARLGDRPVGSLNLPAVWNTVVRLGKSAAGGAALPVGPPADAGGRIVMIADRGEFGCGLVEVAADASLHRLDCPTKPTERIVGARALPSEGSSCLEYVAGDLLKTPVLRVGVHCLDEAPGSDAARASTTASRGLIGPTVIKHAWHEGARWFAITPSGRVVSFGLGERAVRAEVPSAVTLEGSMVIRHLGAHLVGVDLRQKPVPAVYSCVEL